MTKSELISDLSGLIKSLGLVFGDIGTSPIYTLAVALLLVPHEPANVLGIVSLIIWTLFVLVTLEYAWLATHLSRNGEGGTLILAGIIKPKLSGAKKSIITLLSFLGISLLIGDGVITPAISILSAVEGIRLIPGCLDVSQWTLIILAGTIALFLFSVQRNGAGKVSGTFGPVMLVWFLTLGIYGFYWVLKCPEVIRALNPLEGLLFLWHQGSRGFFLLSAVILCSTGGEAMYTDMGHLGRLPIVRGWYFVYFTLILCYLGQGAFLLLHTGVVNPLFSMVNSVLQPLYVPFLILSIMATVIASQAMISGMFSIAFQAMAARLIPLFKIDYTSAKIRTQIYIGIVNWFLCFFVLLLMVVFKCSAGLAAAYGLAVTGDMTITGILMCWLFFLRKRKLHLFGALTVVLVDLTYLCANLHKIPQGGYWSLVISSIPFLLILLYTRGQRRLFERLKPTSLTEFREKYLEARFAGTMLDGNAVFLARDPNFIPPYIVRTFFTHRIIYRNCYLVSVSTTTTPFGVSWTFGEEIAPGLRPFLITTGYMEQVELEQVLTEAGINAVAVFYGVEEIDTESPIWKIFRLIRKITPHYIEFYHLPSEKLHGVVTRVQM
ncbi:MAG: KUP/HAK/KT family potassium transporter [Candidatus Wallbacteria bacterium]|nr:KUP/HAK/KT family potassium transporter [Candidatus Wallbacteria bacterium]